MKTFIALALFGLLLSLSSCQSSPPPADPLVENSSTPSSDIARLPTEEEGQRPAPEHGARVMEAFGEKVLASQEGDYAVHLKPAGANLDVSLIKTGRAGQPGFSTGATSGPNDFVGRISKDLDEHPEFKKPLLLALKSMTQPQIVEELSLTTAHQKAGKKLLEALEKS